MGRQEKKQRKRRMNSSALTIQTQHVVGSLFDSSAKLAHAGLNVSVHADKRDVTVLGSLPSITRHRIVGERSSAHLQ